jgi:hypothetical protein
LSGEMARFACSRISGETTGSTGLAGTLRLIHLRHYQYLRNVARSQYGTYLRSTRPSYRHLGRLANFNNRSYVQCGQATGALLPGHDPDLPPDLFDLSLYIVGANRTMGLSLEPLHHNFRQHFPSPNQQTQNY